MRFRYMLSLLSVAAIALPLFTKGQTTGTDTIFQVIKVINKNDISNTHFTNLADLLQYELNMDIERYPADGGARLRTLDLSSRYCKVLINGIPVSGNDMFGGDVDISTIALNNVDSIILTNAPQGVIYGSGTVAGIVNIITAKVPENGNTNLRVFVQEASAGNEYNMRSGNAAKGRHLQSLQFDHRLSPKFTIGISGMRHAFNGYRGKFNGLKPIGEYSYGRGFEWSPYTAYNADAYIAYKAKGWSAFYTGSYSHSDLTWYNPLAQEWDGNIFYATDFRYVNNRERHHLNVQYRFQNNVELSADISYQDGGTKRRIAPVNTETNRLIEDVPLQTLYHTKTGYAKMELKTPVSETLHWGLGLEADRTTGFIAAADGTYQTVDLNRRVFSRAGYTWLQWRPDSRLAFRPGARIAGNGLSKARPSFSLAADYRPDDRNDFKLIVEQVQRFPNHRELFTFLENEFNMLRGNEKLQPETGKAAILTWQRYLWQAPGKSLQLTLESGYRELKNRIIIAADEVVGIQERYHYANVNHYSSWSHGATLHVGLKHMSAEVAAVLTGFRGNDHVDAGDYGKYLYHVEARAGLKAEFWKSSRLSIHYKFTGRQEVYTQERETSGFDIVRVHNRAPAYHLLDVNVEKGFAGGKLKVSIGGTNLINVKQIDFYATDGQEHYRGDLRTLYPGYGRSGYVALIINN